MNYKTSIVLLAFLAVPAFAFGQSSVLRVVREPRQVSSVSSKTEKGWTSCKWCASKISYDRTYKWDPYDKEWIETTKTVPDTCRKCKSKDKELEKLRREEANLDRNLELKKTKKRVAEKREQLRNWTSENQ